MMILAPALLALSAPPVSVKTLLPEMTDMMHLTRRATPAYTMAQASSYDRKSNPGPNSDPFANGDAGQFIRTENVDGRTEYVMADLKGPGAVVRVWSANPAGMIRFYFDGEKDARLSAKMADLLTGKVQPFIGPFAYGASMGTNMYFPLPYAKSLRVTVDNTDENKARALYYQVGYRTYTSGTAVKTFTDSDLRENAVEMIRTRRTLEAPQAVVPKAVTTIKSGPATVNPGGSFVQRYSGGGALRELSVNIPFPLVQTFRAMDWTDPHQPHNILRTMQISLTVDGAETVKAPLGDFFATAPGINPLKTLPFEVKSDGTMICRLPIPFQSSVVAKLTNTGTVPVPLTLIAKQSFTKPANGFYTLHARWAMDKGSTRPMRDMEFLNVRGEGYWLGSNLHVSNPTPAWWGEGDEKVFVDGESFPSTFGTGTEDYYGYAWCSPQLFARPYHAQPKCDGPGNFGQTNVNRFHILDPIPYRRSMKFDMEMWHWEEVDASFAHTAYWYAPPSNARSEIKDVLPPELKPPAPVKGAIEGEKMRIVSKTGGTTENQGGFWALSGGEQLWWRDNKDGDKLVLAFNVPEAGRYEVFGNFCHARDYGIHELRLDGQAPVKFDFFGTGVTWKKLSLGTYQLSAGEHRLEVTCVGKRPEALPARMFGLDYLLLEKAQSYTEGSASR